MSVYTYTTLDNPSAHSTTQPLGINDPGQVVGIFDLPIIFSTYYGFLYSGGSYTTLSDPSSTAPNGSGTFASGINAFGQIVGYYRGRTGNNEGFLYSGGTWTTLDDPLATISTEPAGINASGQIVGSFRDNSGYHGFLYSGGIYTTLDGPQTISLTHAQGINAAGQIVGWYANASGTHGFLYFGNFSSLGENDMILRNSGTGGMQVYDIKNNQITGTAFLGTVGLNWQMAGVSNHGTQSDLVLRDSGTGGLQIYNISNNAITGAAFLGAVGLDWQASGFGDFSSRNEGDMLLRNVNTGGLLIYDISNNQITGSFFLGNVGLDWQYAGIAPRSWSRHIRPGAAQCQHRRVSGLQHRRQYAGGISQLGCGRTGLAARRLRRLCSGRRHRQL
jgi:probable HAF family extracellular repeat protein